MSLSSSSRFFVNCWGNNWPQATSVTTNRKMEWWCVQLLRKGRHAGWETKVAGNRADMKNMEGFILEFLGNRGISLKNRANKQKLAFCSFAAPSSLRSLIYAFGWLKRKIQHRSSLMQLNLFGSLTLSLTYTMALPPQPTPNILHSISCQNDSVLSDAGAQGRIWEFSEYCLGVFCL